MKRIAVILLTAIVLGSCVRESKTPAAFMEVGTASLTYKGTVVLSYRPTVHQLSYNESSRTFRLFTDDASLYYWVSCSALPSSEGQKIEANVEWNSGSGIQKRNGVSFTVKRVRDDLAWLWSPKENLGLVVQTLK